VINLFALYATRASFGIADDSPCARDRTSWFPGRKWTDSSLFSSSLFF